MDQAKERICEIKDKTFEIIQSEEKKERTTKKVKKAYGISSKEPICRLLQKKKKKGTMQCWGDINLYNNYEKQYRGSSSPISGFIFTLNENRISKRFLYSHIHYNILTIAKVWKQHVSIKRCIDK